MIGSMMLMMALARCRAEPSNCQCEDAPLDWAVVGQVVAGPDGGAVVSTTAAFGSPPGDVTTTAPIGTRVVESPLGFLTVDAESRVRCFGIDLDANTHAAALVDGSCYGNIQAAGYRQPPCNDTGCFCSSGAGPLLLGLALLLKRRTRPC